MENRVYTPNSHKYKEEQKKAQAEGKKIEKVTHGPVTTKKKSSVHKIANVLISEDAGSVKSHILSDVLVPAIKNTILDIITDSANMIFGGSSNKRGNVPASKVSYGSFFGNNQRATNNTNRQPSRTAYSYDDLAFTHRADAMAVLDCLLEALDRYGQVTVADLYDAAGQSCEFTDHDYGWINLSTAYVDRTRDGYVIKLPRALPIDK